MFDVDDGDSERTTQLSWVSDGRVVRWDEAELTGDGLGGEMIFDDGGEGVVWCGWGITKKTQHADATCSRGSLSVSRFWNYLHAPFMFPTRVEFKGTTSIAGNTGECYHVWSNERVSSDICLTASGIPLEIVSTVIDLVGTVGLIKFEATDVKLETPAADLSRFIIDDPAALTSQTRLRTVSPSQLRLPDLPVVHEFSASP